MVEKSSLISILSLCHSKKQWLKELFVIKVTVIMNRIVLTQSIEQTVIDSTNFFYQICNIRKSWRRIGTIVCINRQIKEYCYYNYIYN